MEYFVAFDATHQALAFEAAFGDGGALAPVPPAIRVGCGMALRFYASDDESARKVAADAASLAGVSVPAGIYAREAGKYRAIAL